MRTYLACAFAIAILFSSAAAFGTITYDSGYEGSGDPFGTSVSSGANGYDPDNSDYGGGYHSFTTDTAGWFSWESTVWVSSYAEGTQGNGSLDAYASADASASGVNYVASDSSVSGTGADSGEPGGDSDGGTEYFDAWTGVFAASYASAEAHVDAQSTSTAYASAEAQAGTNMY
jgi:hypothetical protein